MVQLQRLLNMSFVKEKGVANCHLWAPTKHLICFSSVNFTDFWLPCKKQIKLTSIKMKDNYCLCQKTPVFAAFLNLNSRYAETFHWILQLPKAIVSVKYLLASLFSFLRHRIFWAPSSAHCMSGEPKKNSYWSLILNHFLLSQTWLYYSGQQNCAFELKTALIVPV